MVIIGEKYSILSIFNKSLSGQSRNCPDRGIEKRPQNE
jgi:hypothetical protein